MVIPATAIADLIADLARVTVADDATNQYAIDGPAGNMQRRANLQLALALAHARGPDILLVGEAPGYNGARRTGVPFTSERLLLAGIEPPGIFGAARGFALASDDGRISSEQTATIVWREARQLGIYIVGWNAFPFHPHRLGQPESNRTPRAGEVRSGMPFLERVHALFPAVQVVAMGNVAAGALSRLKIAHLKVRHPAQGGAREFAVGLRKIS